MCIHRRFGSCSGECCCYTCEDRGESFVYANDHGQGQWYVDHPTILAKTVTDSCSLAFFAGEERFYIKGIDYQPGGSSDAADGSDPLADTQACQRDIATFKDLGINTVRVYTVDNSKWLQ